MLANCFHEIAPGFKQSSGNDRSINRLDLGYCFQIEADDHDTAVKTMTIDELGHGPRQVDIGILRLAGFHFHIDDPGTLFEKIENLIESGNKLRLEFGSSELRIRATKPTAHIRLAKFAGSHSRDDSLTNSCSPQIRIVNDYGDAVAGQANVQLDSISAVFQSSPESNQGIFRSQSRSAPMTDYQW